MSEKLVHQIEPELLGPKPRRITAQLDPGSKKGLGCVTLFFAPFVLVGLYTLLLAINGTLMGLWGRTVPGQIIECYYESGDDEGGGGWKVRYDYRVGEREFIDTDDDRSTIGLQTDDLVPVRFAPWLPGWDSMALPSGTSLWGNCTGRWCFTLVWNGIQTVFFGLFCWGTILQRSVYAKGETAVGTIVDKVIKQGERPKYALEYEYGALSTGLASLPLQKKSTSVSEAKWNSVEIGDKVTVLYDAQNPSMSVIYRFGGYKIVAS